MCFVMYSMLYILVILHVLSSPLYATETTCTKKEIDLAVLSQDYGRHGIAGPMNISLVNGLQFGAAISVVAKSYSRGSINLYDQSGNVNVLHIDARIYADYMVLNTYRDDCNGWCIEHLPQQMPIVSDIQATTTIIYEVDGFRIFINSKELYFYKHVATKTVNTLEISQDHIYKVIYVNPVTI